FRDLPPSELRLSTRLISGLAEIGCEQKVPRMAKDNLSSELQDCQNGRQAQLAPGEFARNLAMGMTKGEAYVAAGYKPDPGNPSRLTENDRVQKRVAELQERAALRTGITIENLTADL